MMWRTLTTLVLAGVLLAACGKQVVPVPSSAVLSPSAGSDVSRSAGPTSSPAVDSSTNAADRSAAGAAVRDWTAVEGRPDPTQFKPVPDLPDIYFEFDKYTVRPDDHRVLDAHASWLRARPQALVIIEGHCDERGTSEYNIALGERRAKSAMDGLVSRGVEAHRITVISYGATRPTCAERDEACYARNRRAHFLVKAG